MEELAFTNLLAVALIAFAVPLGLGLAPALRLPSVVVELLAGIVVGPAVLGWVEVDEAVEVLSVLGLAFLLFLAGLEIELQRLRGRILRVALLAFALSFAVGLLVAFALDAAGVAGEPVFIAIVLTATSLGVVVPLLKDAGEVGSIFGQLVIAASSIADFATVILLSLLFAEESASTVGRLVLVAALFGVVALVVLAVRGVEHLGAVRAALQRLQDTTAQIRVRGAVLLLVGLVALATELGLEVILGAFLAGAALTLVDRDEAMTHPELRRKLDAVGYGVFVPVFFVTSGLTYDLDALTADGGALAYVPLFLAALLAVRGLPALLYRPLVPPGRVLVSALLQATSLPFIVAATAIGQALGVISAANAAALIAAGLLSVLVFPAAALALLRRDPGMRRRLHEARHERDAALDIGRPVG
jgi:Kef-type K+ transport system membrane component KefB